MLVSYQPPKFQQLDEKENPHQYVAHFVKTCNNVGTNDNLIVKQFFKSLKGNTFNWCTNLELGIIDD
ncbi:hypothetical protein J1N35_001788 [Gossypium stocksii]|uniref:Retrotransposon gag domain-containing protein n=1 Tax=Gossypium stocksii TaxID=47602 RepID=A0A9D4AJY3_9ROSI|nr:hypothetical protein J1N35_001788 [Gossypium stocksii]